jgi:NAD(P)H-nitrite reductase large subunit
MTTAKMNDKKPYLIIGNSAAAVGAVEGIRSIDPDTPITIVSREERPCYSRPLISYLLGGKVDESRMNYRPDSFHEKMNVDLITGVEAQELDVKGRSINLSDGREIRFEKLLIATGGTPVVPPPFAGEEIGGVFTFTTWDDADSIRAYIKERAVKNAVVVGGGLIGLKSMEALVALRVNTTIVELADRILSMTFDRAASQMAQGHLAESGVEVVCDNTVARVETENGAICGVELRDGRRILCELVIIAIGVRPNCALARDAAIAVDRGIVVDDYMETSVEGIYAAGDVAQANDMLLGETRPIPILPVAYRQGFIAGVNMAGGSRRYGGGLAMNSVEILGLPTISVGMTSDVSEDMDVLVKTDERKKIYKKIVLDEGRVIGAIFIGDIDKAGIVTGLIRGKIDVSGFRNLLLTDEFGLISLPAGYRKHVVSGMGIEV